MSDSMEGYRLASTCCRVTGCSAPADADAWEGVVFCAHHATWHCPVCYSEGRYREAERQYDRFGIYCGRMCDACYQASGYASYEPDPFESMEEEPSCYGLTFDRCSHD